MIDPQPEDPSEQIHLQAIATKATSVFALARASVDYVSTTQTDPDFGTTMILPNEAKAERLRHFRNSLPARREEPKNYIREAAALASYRILNVLVAQTFSQDVESSDPKLAASARSLSRLTPDDIDAAQKLAFDGWKSRGNTATKMFDTHKWQTEIRPIFLAMKDLNSGKPGLENIRAKTKIFEKDEIGKQIRIRMDTKTLQALRSAEGLFGPAVSLV